MNILYIVHRIPYPPDKGDKIRSFHQIRQLSKSHTVHLACLVDEPGDLEYTAALRKYCGSVETVYRGKFERKVRALQALFSRKPLSVSAFYSQELNVRIQHFLRSGKIDFIIAYSSAMAEYVASVAGIPKVIDFVDVDSEKWRAYTGYHCFPLSMIYRLEADRLARYEEWAARNFDHSIFVTLREAELFHQRVSDRPVSVIQNGVDIEYFKPVSGSSLTKTGTADIVFTGAMDYFPNVDAVSYFCDTIFPRVLKELPQARFYIVGRNPTKAVVRLGKRGNVIVTGSVPDVRPYLAQATVAVAPFRIARGVQNKVLEAMAMSLPVVGTSNAFQGIQATREDGIRWGDDPARFAQEVLTFLKEPELSKRCGEAGREYVLRCHSWDTQGEALEALLRNLAG
jgi:sugar transferase (PEP-CTERM/EpsH1 system associated)